MSLSNLRPIETLFVRPLIMLASLRCSSRALFSTSLKIKPVGNGVIVDLEKASEKVGRILVPEAAQQQTQQGVVLAIGPGALVDGERVPMSVKVGDRVLLPSFGGTVVKLDNKEYKFVDDDSILAIFS
jgi:chaperonin GroES